MIIRIVILSFIGGLVLACAPAHNTYGGSDPGGGDQTLGDDPGAITFAEVNQKIFTPMCVRCHATFNDHAVVTARLNAIVSAIGANRMPQTGPPVPDDLKTLLADWVAQGAKLE